MIICFICTRMALLTYTYKEELNVTTVCLSICSIQGRAECYDSVFVNMQYFDHI